METPCRPSAILHSGIRLLTRTPQTRRPQVRLSGAVDQRQTTHGGATARTCRYTRLTNLRHLAPDFLMQLPVIQRGNRPRRHGRRAAHAKVHTHAPRRRRRYIIYIIKSYRNST